MRFTEAPGGNQDIMVNVLGKHISYFLEEADRFQAQLTVLTNT